MGGGDSATMLQNVTFKLTPEPTPPAKPRDIHYDPKTFFCYYSAANNPDLHVFLGDIVHTWTPHAGGVDSKGTRLVHGGDCNVGPIFIEGALPGRYLSGAPAKSAPTAQRRDRAAASTREPHLPMNWLQNTIPTLMQNTTSMRRRASLR
jgi:hypothetical protein